MNVTETERTLYRDVWGTVRGYADYAPGEHHVPLFLDMSGATAGTVLDAGCGSGKGAVALAKEGFEPTLLDLTDDGLVDEARRFLFIEGCLWKPQPYVFEWAYCCDVLEHVPTEYTMLAISRLLESASRGVFLSIALVPDVNGLWVGKPLHQTVRDYEWWRDRLRDLGTLIESRDLILTGVYLVKAR